MTKKEIRILANLIATILSAIIAFGMTYLDSKYFLMGVEVERGYKAAGGEILFLIILFCIVYCGIKYLSIKMIKNLIEEIWG